MKYICMHRIKKSKRYADAVHAESVTEQSVGKWQMDGLREEVLYIQAPNLKSLFLVQLCEDLRQVPGGD